MRSWARAGWAAISACAWRKAAPTSRSCAHGLTVESAHEPLRLEPVEVTGDPATIGPVDVVLFGVKLWDTEPAARAILPLIGLDTAVISFQNGVQKDDTLRPIVGAHAIVGGAAYIGAAIARPGVIAHTGTMQRLVFGEYDGRRSARIEAFLAACRAGGINAEISADITRELWEKYAFLVALSGATASIRLPLGPIRSHPLTRRFLLDLAKEVVAVGRAHGVALPVDFAEQRIAFADALPAEMTASMHHDLGVVDLGQKVGVPTPVNRAVRDILILHADGRRA